MRRGLVLVAGVLIASTAAGVQLPPVPEKTGREPTRRPQLFVVQKTIDLGKVEEGEKRTVQWLLENRGDADLVIERTQSSCGCTVVNLKEQDKVIPPGGSLKLTAEFDSRNRKGLLSKTVTVSTNDPGQPTSQLEFKADVSFLFVIKPNGLVNLKSIRREQRASEPIEVLPGPGKKSVRVVAIKGADDSPLSFEIEPFETDKGMGQRIYPKVGAEVSLGPLKAGAIMSLEVDGAMRVRPISFRGEVVGDLSWRPKVVDATGQASGRGKQFAPVTIQSTDEVPFDLIGATAGPLFDVVVKPGGSPSKRTQYMCVLTLRDDAPAGPFGATLEVRTSSLDQPVVHVPIFGTVADLVLVEPSIVAFRQDGTDVGAHRRVKLQVIPQLKLEVSDVRCDNDAVAVEVDTKASSAFHHIRFLDVRLVGKLPKGNHTAVLSVTTNIVGAERLEVPVTITAPE